MGISRQRLDSQPPQQGGLEPTNGLPGLRAYPLLSSFP